MNLKAKKFPETKGWAYRITYYKDGVANTIVLAGKVTWNGADYEVDEESYNTEYDEKTTEDDIFIENIFLI